MSRALLAALLLDPNRALSYDRLEALLWVGRPPARSRASLHNHLMRLRRSLGDASRIRSQAGALVLGVEDGELDHVLFTRQVEAAHTSRLTGDWPSAARSADAALSLWRGEPLAEFPTLALDAVARVAEWQEARLQAVELRAEAALHQGHHVELLTELTGLAQEFPLRESFHAQLLQVLHRMGRRAEALEVYHRLRRTLVDTMGVEPGPAVRTAYHEALDDEPAPEPAGTAAVRSPAGAFEFAVPNALPRDVAAFTGRISEIDRLLTAAETDPGTLPGVVGIHAIDGMPGVGKTALAVHVAHRLKDAFPDGQIFLPLHAHTPGTSPVDSADALTTLLLAVGENPQRIPTDPTALAGLWRSRLAGRRVLVLLDDARGSAQVEPLLPGTPGSMVLVTSRRRLESLTDATPLSLGVLTPDEAVHLIVTKAARPDVTADDPTVRDLAALCGHLPLALQLVAARLRHRPTWSPGDLVRDLGAAHGGLDALASENASVAAAFDLSFQDLSPQSRQLFQRLGLVPGDCFDAHAAAAIEGISVDSARALLEDLENRHLVEERARGRYRMHDLVRAYARARATEDTAAPVERLLDYYLHATTAADRRLARFDAPYPVPTERRAPAVPVFRDAEDATAWMRVERENLRAAVEYAADHRHPVHTAYLPAAMAEFLRANGPWPDALALHRTALDAAVLTGDLTMRAVAHHNKATIECLRGHYEPAEEGFQRALALVREARDRHWEGIVLSGLGRVQRLTGRFDDAISTFRDALACCTEAGDMHGQAGILTELGHVQQLTGDFAQAEASVVRSLRLRRGREDIVRANALTGLGDILKSTGRYAESVARHREALALFERLDVPLGVANSLIDLGDVLRLLGAYDEAVRTIARALGLAREIGGRMGLAQALTFLARVQLRLGQHTEAARGLREALAICEELGSPFARAYATMHLAEAESALGEHAEALELALESVELCRRTQDRGGRANALVILGGVRLTAEDPEEALRCYEEALALARDIRAPYDEARALEGAGRALARLGSVPESRARFCRALTIDERLRVPDAARLRALLSDVGAGSPRAAGQGRAVAASHDLPRT
ncbi:ATP-binding protein [Streptomyces sp. NPDC017254]|uniref:ATP-binding protein n=1 Tax=unclassified Streptomyces TaxID=2593676 RepID=UPI00378DDFE2